MKIAPEMIRRFHAAGKLRKPSLLERPYFQVTGNGSVRVLSTDDEMYAAWCNSRGEIYRITGTDHRGCGFAATAPHWKWREA